MYPYFWRVQINNFNDKIIYLNIIIWIYGLSKIFYLKKKKINLKKKLYKIFKKNKKEFFISKLNLNQKTNFWFSDFNFIKISKYANLGYNLSKKLTKTYQML